MVNLIKLVAKLHVPLILIGLFYFDSVAQETIVIRDVNLISMCDPSKPLDAKMDILITGDRFKKIGPNGSFQIPNDAVIVEGKGLFMIPGLADAHVHFDFDPPATEESQFVHEENDILRRLFLLHGVTFVRSMWGSPNIVRLRDDCRDGKILGPTIVTTGPLLSASSVGPVRKLEDEQDVLAVLADHEKFKYDALKIHSKPSEAAVRLLFLEAGKRNIPVYGHLPFSVNATVMLSFPELKSIEHLDTIVGTCVRDDSNAKESRWPDLMKMYDEQDAAKQQQWAKLAANSNKWFCPTLMASQVDALSTDEFGARLKQVAATKLVSSKTLGHWQNSLAYEKTLYEKSGIRLKSLYQAPCDIMSEFIRAKVKIVAGTDTPVRPGVAGQVLHAELSEYVRLNMSPWAAIQTATANVSEMVGGEFGKIEAGLFADAVLLRDNPLESIGNLEQIESVIVRGKVLNRNQLDRLELEVKQLVQQKNLDSR
ncbi:MAG: amidohydrolase family protein [Planctomycetota bacterium]